MKTPDPYANYPTDWFAYQTAKSACALSADFPRYALVNRFGARFRAARAYRGSTFEGYASGDTATGYNALVALILAFSAFEYLYKVVLGLNVPDMLSLLEAEHGTTVTDAKAEFAVIGKSEDALQLFDDLRPHLDNRHQASINDVLSGRGVNLIRILAAIRHAFVHGHLTPNMGGVSPTTVIELSLFGFEFLMLVMDKEFSRLVS